MVVGQALLSRNKKVPQKQQQTQGTAAAQEQCVQQEQSLELVQTLLGASIGCLSFLRGLLPEECFVEKRYGGDSSAVASYRSFISDIDEDSYLKKTKTESGVRVKRLRRGYSNEADQLLDWLETGIFHALGKGYLKAVQLGIYIDKESPDVIVEAYTFSFSYRKKEDDGTTSISLRVTDNAGHGVTVNDANKNIQQIMRRLIVITQNLPPLPDKRWLTIRLYYMDHTPKDYDPPDFNRLAINAPGLRFRQNEENEVEKMDCGALNTGFHAISLKISSVHESDVQERPKRRYVSRFVHADNDIETPKFTIPAAHNRHSKSFSPLQTPNKVPQEQPSGGSTGSGVHGGDKNSMRTSLENPKGPAGNSTNTFMEGSDANKEQCDKPIISNGRDTREKAVLREMLLPAARDCEMIETQPLEFSQSSQRATQRAFSNLNLSPPKPPQTKLLPRLHSTRILPEVTQESPELLELQNLHVTEQLISEQTGTSLNHLTITHASKPQDSGSKSVSPLQKPQAQVDVFSGVGKHVAKLRISRARIEELQNNKRQAITSGLFEDQKGKGKGKKHNNDEKTTEEITCECGDCTDDYGMICCDNCDGWQHANCYGFLFDEDPRIADYHVCYTCLLPKTEGKLLEEMRGLALFRRALKRIWDENSFPISNKNFSERLGCDLPTALQITKRLEKEGFIAAITTTRPRRNQKKIVNNGPIKYKVIKTEETKYNMDTLYFDPLTKISHHYDLSTEVDNTLLEDSPLLPAPPEATGLNEMGFDEDSQLADITGEAIFISQKKSKATLPHVDPDTTDDDGDENIQDAPPADQYPKRVPIARPNLGISHKLQTPSGSALNVTSAEHAHGSSSEIATAPEPMDIDMIVESQLEDEGMDQTAGSFERIDSMMEGISQEKSKVSVVMQNLYVGVDCEL